MGEKASAMVDAVRRAMGYKFPPLGPCAFRWFSRWCPKRIDTELLPRLHVTLDLTDEMQRVLYWQGLRYEKPTLDFLVAQSRDACAFFDIGANIGFVSYVMLWHCPALAVYAFEPNPHHMNIMREARQRNGLTRFTPVACGLAAASGERSFHIALRNSGHSTFGAHPDLTISTDACRRVVVPLMPFEEWRVKEGLPLPPVGGWLAKVDVEGYELEVLQGMAPSLAAQRFRCVCVELNPFTLGFCGRKPEDILRWMSRFDYDAYDDSGHKVTAEHFCEAKNVFFLSSAAPAN